MWYFSMISVSKINWVRLSFAYVGGIGFVDNDVGLSFAFGFELEFFLLPLGDEVVEPWIWTSGIVRGI